MTIDQIKSDFVRAIISGSPTPATDLRDKAAEMSVADFREACAYFGGYSRLVEHAIAEHNWCFEHNV